MADKVIVSLTNGEDDPERVTLGYLTAGAALGQGSEVVMWLSVDAVRLAVAGGVDGLEAPGPTPVRDLHAQYVDGGGRFYVCPICFNARGLDSSALVQGAELKGATPLMEFAAGGALTFSY